MAHRFRILTMALLCALPPAVGARSLTDMQADSLLSDTKIIHIDGRPTDADMSRYLDSVRNVISDFYYEQFRHYQDPVAPYFLFLSKDATLAMGLGGAVRMRGYYDWGGAIPASGFAPYLIPMDPDPAKMRHFDTTPAGTCLFFRVIGSNKALGNYQLYIEANFNGYGARDFHLKKAYAIINDFTVGYAASTFSDPAAIPPTVDAQGPNNKISPTSVLLRYMPVIKDRWVLALSVETPSPAIDTDGNSTAPVDNWLPDFATFVQYQWDRGQHVRLSGIVRNLGYRNLLTQTNHNRAGWGVQLSAVAHPAAPLTTYFTFNYGHGYEGLGGDLLIGRYDLVADPSQPGRLYAPAAWGCSVGLQYNFRPNLFMTLVGSGTRYCPSHAASADEYKAGVFAALNVFWNPTPRMQVGAEVDFGRRKNFSGAHRDAHRVGAMCQFSF